MIDTIQEKKCSSKYAVLFLWASLANAVPITFWTLAYILCNEDVHKQLMKEMKDAFSGHCDEKSEYLPLKLLIDFYFLFVI